MYPRLNRGGFLITQKAPQAKNFRGISYEKHNKNAFSRGKTQQKRDFWTFREVGNAPQAKKKCKKVICYWKNVVFFARRRRKIFG